MSGKRSCGSVYSLVFMAVPQLLSVVLMAWATFIYANNGFRENDLLVCLIFLSAIILGLLLFAQLGTLGCRLMEKHHALIIGSVAVWLIFLAFSLLTLFLALIQSSRMPKPTFFN